MVNTRVPDKTVIYVPEQEEGGSFLTGFVFGALAGACGLFFFGTKQGKDAIKGFNKEWDEVKKKLETEFGKEFQNMSFTDSLKEVLVQVEEHLVKEEKPQTARHARPPKKRLFFH